jgi:predicted SnoaL-like aldol condensation-catalyzing enzyme
MSTEQNKATVRRLYAEVFEGLDLGVVDEIALPDYQEHGPLPGQGTGSRGLKDRASILGTAFAPRFSLEDVIAEGDRVVVRWKNQCTHVGDFPGLPATGKSYSINGIDVYRFQEGKLAEHWHVVDQLSMLQQLGVLPTQQQDGGASGADQEAPQGL